MKKEFIERVIREHIVDTRKYRYIYQIDGDVACIKRIERFLLGTTAVYDRWEVVKVWRVVK